MFSQSQKPSDRAAQVALCMLLVGVGLACLFAGTARASYYKMVLCAGNNGSNGYQTATNTNSSQNPGGIFSFENYCGPAPFPAGNNGFLRIAENQGSGTAGYGAYGSISWTTTPWVDIVAGGGYTREPDAFNDGWRGRFWLEGWDNSTNNILMQGAGLENGSCGGVCWATTPVFASHLWPFNGYGKYRRFVFELTCLRQAGCDRTNFNAVDANTMILTLNDVDPSRINLTGTAAGMLSGEWVRGAHPVTWAVSDLGSGIRVERVRVDGGQRAVLDSACDLGNYGDSGEFARVFRPCPDGGPYHHDYGLDTASLADGEHVVSVCSQDYGQAAGLNGTGGESCDQRTIRVDNSAPGKPAALQVKSSNPNRYLSRFNVSFSLPPDPGSPVVGVHYQVLNAANEIVVPTQTALAFNPTEAKVEAPDKPGAYHLRVWLSDLVGFAGPAAEVEIPRDTTPPAAPQALRVTGTSGRWGEKVDLRWTNIVDNGSPISLAQYRFLDAGDQPIGPVRTVGGANPQMLEGVIAPPRGEVQVQVWLTDAEGNVGAPATVPLPLDTTPPAAPQALQVIAPDARRQDQGFDVRWENIADNGSPIDHAHYQVLDGAGNVVVATHDLSGENPRAITDLDAPKGVGDHKLKVWLSDAEGNVGAPSEVPLAYDCPRSDVAGGLKLTAGIGGKLDSTLTVHQGEASTVGGSLSGSGPLGGATICVFSRIATDSGTEFLGTAMTGKDGSYKFPLPAGPSREVITRYRDGHRQIAGRADALTRIEPTLYVRKKVIRNKHKAVFYGDIPGPHNDNVVIVLQVKHGKGWRAFRRYRTRGGGHYEVAYRFTQTGRETVYIMRAQVRPTVGLPYEPGNSREIKVRVKP